MAWLPDSVATALTYVAVAFGAIIVYETVRGIVKRALQKRLSRNLQQFLESPDLYRQSFKFTNKLVIQHQLLADPEINAKILEFAAREKQDIEAVREKVRGYIDEIVPSFNLLTYYKLGYPLAKSVVHLLYDPVVDQERKRLMEKLPPNASPVFVMNHRSNFDFVLLSYMLAGKVSISYAVGEWARVWPLEHLFKSFGSYFVRRGYKEDLYHKVLERYVQLIATHGVTQAVFPEGGLTRDGKLRPPKLGLITWLARLEADHRFERNLVFIPVGVNYDWVIEDDNLVKEAQGVRKDTGFWKKAYVVLLGPFMLVAILGVNAARYASGRLKRHGYSSLSFAEPIVLKDWLAERNVVFGSCSENERKALVAQFGDELMRRIGEAVPATPATLLSVAILDNLNPVYSFHELVPLAQRARDEMERKGIRVVVGAEFQRFQHALLEHEAERKHVERPNELEGIGEQVVKQDETEALVRFALDILVRNKIVRKHARKYHVRYPRLDHLRYYANSLAHRLGRDYPIGSAHVGAGAAHDEGIAKASDRASMNP